MRKKRILFISNWYPNSSALNLGIFIKRHAEAINLFAELTTVAVTISPSNKLFKKHIHHSRKSEVGDLIHIEIKSRLWKFITFMPFYQYRLIKKEIKKLDEPNFDLVQSNVLFMSGIIAARFSDKLNIPLVHVEHWSEITVFLKKSIYKRFGLKALKRASAIVCVSDFFKNDVRKSLPNDNILVIPNVISDNFQVVKKKKSDTIRFLAVANWEIPKMPEIFFYALQELERKGLIFELTIIGNGALLEDIKRTNFSFKISFLGDLKNKDIVPYYQNADIFLHASSYETFSVVPIESLLTGTPVVASRVGVLPEVINQDNGVLCDNTIDAWVKGIQTVMNTTYDTEKIRNSVDDKFSIATVSKQFEELYSTILD